MKKQLLLIVILLQFAFGQDGLRKRDEPYRIQPSDQVQISYRYTPEYDETLTVQPDGVVSLKLVGPVKIEGLSVEEARARIQDALKQRLNDPEITLTLTDFVRPSFVIVGQVTAPGKYELRGNVTAIRAVALAGGFKDNARHSQIILFRSVNKDIAKTQILDLKKLMDPKHPKLEEDVSLEPGDLLIVPKNRISKIADYVHWINVGSYFPL